MFIEPEVRDQAWIGDAVLALYARLWTLDNTRSDAGGLRTEVFTRFTSNQFLSCFGEPTRVEAEIGRIYAAQGLAAAFNHITAKLLPVFISQLNKQSRLNRGPVYSICPPSLPVPDQPL